METQWSIRSTDSKLYAFIVAILPCIMMYKVPILEKGATTIIVLFYAVILFLCFHQLDLQKTKILLPGIVYLIYIVSRSEGNWIEIILQIAAYIHLYAICMNAMNISACKRCIKIISVTASVCVIIQYFIHVLLDMHIPMIASELCLDELSRYKYTLITGMNEGIYRPSAFFLEPSHMAEYLMIGLGLSLLDERKDYNKAVTISFGMIFTTSGMGVVILICIWGWFYFSQIYSHKNNKMHMFIIGIIVAFAVVVIAISIPGFQRILARIFGTFGEESSDYNAIHGRLFWWNAYFSNFKGHDLLFGKGSAAVPDDYFTGFMEILYAYGIIGVCLYYNMLLYLLRKSNNAFSSCVIILLGGLMAFANLAGFIQTIFYLGMIIAVVQQYSNASDMIKPRQEEFCDNSCQYIR